MMDWKRYNRKLSRPYKGEGVAGRAPFDTEELLKVELLAYLYHESERQLETSLNENLPAKYFAGLVQRGKMRAFKETLEEIECNAARKGVRFDSIQIVVSVHSDAHVNAEKDE